jgi:hypothetical protein
MVLLPPRHIYAWQKGKSIVIELEKETYFSELLHIGVFNAASAKNPADVAL